MFYCVLRALLLRRRMEDELDDEVQFHLAMQARKNRAAGMSAVEAGRAARLEFGGIDRAKEQCRDARGVSWIETLAQDVRYALRGIRRSPGFALTVAATLALGLGLNTTVFTIFNAYVLRPLAVRDPYGLYQFTWVNRGGEGHLFTWREFQDFRKNAPAFSEVLGFRTLSIRAEGHVMFGQLVTGNYFRMVGVVPALGRTLAAGDTASPGGAPVVVLSSTAWKNKFGGDRAIVGKTIVVHGYPLEVIGVAAAGFGGLGPVPLDFWAPLTMDAQLAAGPDLFGAQQPERIRLVGRLRPGISARQAEAALSVWSRQSSADRPAEERATGVALRSQATTVTLEPDLLLMISPIFVAFGLVLAIACANVANMMLARAMARQREIGIRLAMGAGRARLIRQLLTESVLLALPGALAGFAISAGTMELCERLMLATLPRGYAEYITLLPLRPDGRVFLFMLAAAVASALMFGLAPAIQATRATVMQAAKGEFTTDHRPARLRNALLIGQVTVSALFLICAAMLLRGQSRMRSLDVGLKTQGVVEIEVQDQWRAKVVDRLAAEPAAAMVAGASKVPLMGYLASTPVTPEGGVQTRAGYLYVSPEYFPVLGIPILQGRGFTTEEARTDAPVAVISQATARKLWPHGDAMGRSLRLVPERTRAGDLKQYIDGPPAYTEARVIGIARDAVNGWVGDADPDSIYFPRAAEAHGDTLLVRVRGDAEAARRSLDTTLAASVPGAVDQIHTMNEILAGQLYPFRALYWLSSAMGGVALMLTLSGLYGVLSYLVSLRTKEIGIRVALGAGAARVAGLVLRQALRFTIVGTAIGALLALGAWRVLASQLDAFVFNGVDSGAFGLGAGLVIAASACAAYIPARRAARIQPITTLRHD